jgi:peptidoglycan/LPS O-acetylase OafA/YrhL
MSSNNLYRIAGIAGILSAVLMLAFSSAADPATGAPLLYTAASFSVGIILVAGLYMLYRSEAPTLSLAASAISVLGYVLLVVASLMQVTFPHPMLAAADITIYIVGLSMFCWQAFRTHKMPRLLAVVGLVAALAGAVSYVVMASTGTVFTGYENLSPVLMALFIVYLIGVVIWLVWTGISLLRMKPAAATVQAPGAVTDQPA